MRLWGSFGGARPLPAPETKDAVTRRASAGPTYTFAGTTYEPTWDLQRIVRDAYDRVIWVYRIVETRAINGSRLPIQITTGDPADGKVVTDHPLLPLLNKQANPHESGMAFRHRVLAQLQLSKRGVFVEVVTNRKGEPTALYLLNPLHTWIRPDPDTFIKDFEVRLPNGETFNLPPYEPGSKTGGVIWMRRPHPIDPYSSTTWVEAAGLSIDLDWYARLYNRSFMLNDGRPGGILSVKGDLMPEDARELQARAQGGPGNAGKITVFEADEMSYLDLSQTPRDAQYVESRGLTKEEILIAGGTPESVLGNASGRTFDNSDAEFENFWTVTMVPDLDLVASFFDLLVGDGWGDDSRVTHDLSTVTVLQRAARAREAQLQAEWEKGLISLDEYRTETGKDPVDVPASRALWLTAGKTPVADDDDFAAIQEQYGGAPQQAPPGEAPMPGEPMPGEEPTPGEPIEEPPPSPEGESPARDELTADDLAGLGVKRVHHWV